MQRVGYFIELAFYRVYSLCDVVGLFLCRFSSINIKVVIFSIL